MEPETEIQVENLIAPDYAVNDGIITYVKNGNIVQNAPVTRLGLRKSVVNRLMRGRIFFLSNLLTSTKKQLRVISGIGEGTLDEIWEQVPAYLETHRKNADSAQAKELIEPLLPALAPDYTIKDGFLYNKNAGKKIPDVPIEYTKGKQLIETVNRDSEILDSQRAQRKDVDAQAADLRAQQATIQNYDLLKQQVKSLSDDLASLQAAQGEWPLLLEESEQLDELISQQEEKELRKKKNALSQKLNTISQCEKEMDACRKAMAGKENIEADGNHCQSLQAEISKAQIRLQSAKFNLTISLEDGHQAVVETAEGEVVRDTQRFADTVKGYAKIAIPDVGEIIVAPESIDVTALTKEISDQEAEVAAVLKRYSVQTVEDLCKAAEQYQKDRLEYEKWKDQQQRELDGRTEEEISAELNGLQGDPSLVVEDDLETKIVSLLTSCAENSLDSRKAVVKKQLKDYQEDYISLSQIKLKIQEKSEALEKVKRKLAAMGEVTMTQEEYDEKLNSVTGQLKTLNENIEKGISNLAPLIKAADDIDIDALRAEQDIKEAEFQRLKRLHAQYFKIKTDFERLKEAESNDPYGEFYNQFNGYLQIIAGGNFSVSSDGKIISGKNSLDKKELLSQGTRKLILLAFRLALLKFYYQDESGVIILDDILLDMDPGRRERATQLLTEFARDNQVIFTTCDPAIAQLLGGNQIEM